MKKTFYNFLYQSIFQVVKIILPIITIPIVSNALGPNGIGTYNYTNSIAQYFVLFAGLGVGVYGNKEIATVSDNKERLTSKFWELFGMSFIVSLVSLISYLVIVSFSDNRFYFYLQSLIIVAALFDVSWFFMGVEDFKKTSLSSLIAQIISFIGIIIFIKKPENLWIYILIQSMNILISQIIMWGFIWEKIDFKKVKVKEMTQHIIPSLQYFIPKIAIILYTNLNKTLLGIMDTKESVGYYTNTIAINSIAVTLVTTLDSVLLPRFSNLISKGNVKAVLQTIKKTLNLQLFFTIPLMFGILTITPKLVPWFFGEKFLLLETTIPMLAPLVIIMPFGLAMGQQYLVPMNRIKTYNLAVITGAIVSILANVMLIPIIGVYGAIFATLLAEFSVAAIRFNTFWRETHIFVKPKKIFSYVVAGGLMYICTTYATNGLDAKISTTIIQIVVGLFTYMVATLILRVNPLYKFLKERKF